MTTLNQKVCIVTGGGSGIGRATVLAMAGLGARVAVVGRTQSKLDTVVDEVGSVGGSARAYIADVTNWDSVATMTRDGQLLRTYRAGQAKLLGYLDDYAYFAEALVELHEATGEQRWLDWARRLADTMLDEFEDERDGGFFFTTASHENMLLRSKSLLGGGNMPSSNGVAAQVLLRLGRITGEPQYTKAAPTKAMANHASSPELPAPIALSIASLTIIGIDRLARLNTITASPAAITALR